jgi:hypothetical protein
MKLRTVTGALLMVFGLAALVYGAAFVKGPLLFWLDPFQADRVQLHAIIVGGAAFIIGAVTIASARGKTSRAQA